MTQSTLDEPILAPGPRHLPLLTRCPVPGCTTLTMGGTCVDHDAPVLEVFPRGRPFVDPTRRNGVPVGAAD